MPFFEEWIAPHGPAIWKIEKSLSKRPLSLKIDQKGRNYEWKVLKENIEMLVVIHMYVMKNK